LAQQTVALRNRLKPYRRMQLQVRDRMAQSLSEHRALLHAIQLADAEAAARAAREHVLVQGQRFNDWMAMLSQRQMAAR
jgi:DNA-binding FadR family transcriptional regulator